jgi:hypothetical protein
MSLLFGIQDPQREEDIPDLEKPNYFIRCPSMNDSAVGCPALNHTLYMKIPTMYDLQMSFMKLGFLSP